MAVCFRFVALAIPAAAAVLAAGSAALAADRLYFEGDMVRGRLKEGFTGPLCVLENRFKRGELMVWRVRIHAPGVKEQLGKDGLKSVAIKLPDGKSYPAKFGTHPPKNASDSYWTAVWKIPDDYPTGTFAYTVVATDKDGKTHEWKPFNIKSSQLTVLAGPPAKAMPPKK
ncbi:MAG: hypothetical protein AB7F96_10385 [Beijerinckiaceae bacterium]